MDVLSVRAEQHTFFPTPETHLCSGGLHNPSPTSMTAAVTERYHYYREGHL
jgi:hypothetical protein